MTENVATDSASDASTNLPIVLASGSPRRQQFLRDLGLAFTVTTADIDETPLPDEIPVPYVRRLAKSKARAVIDKLPDADSPRLLIAADTIVALDTDLLGKPVDEAEARAMLTRLRGQVHQVISCFTMVRLDEQKEISDEKIVVNSSDLHMRNYSDDEILAYIATGDPMDKAGAYAIQHPTFSPGEKLDGCISGVMGLPLSDLVSCFDEFDIKIDKPIPPLCEEYTGFTCCER